MELILPDSSLGQHRARQWTPLVTQQFRLRHVHQIFAFNFPPPVEGGSYYFTLHLTTMSAPFYTSEKVFVNNPKWPELDQRHLLNLASMAVVLRIWSHSPREPDKMMFTWGINLSGLVYLGPKICDIQPAYFNKNTIILAAKGGFFTSLDSINFKSSKPLPFLENMNVQSVPGAGGFKVVRCGYINALKDEIMPSYNINKLRKLHSLQLTLKNKSQDVQNIRDKIEQRKGSDCRLEPAEVPQTSSSPSNVRYAPQLLTMNSLNKMLEEKPTKTQRKEMEKVRNAIEIAQFRCKLLSHERDKKSALIRRLKNKLKELADRNEESTSDLMDRYYRLSRESERLNDLRRSVSQQQELYLALHKQLNHRIRQLFQQLLFIYPIEQLADNKFVIHGIYLPNSDILSDCSDTGISVALGYITHILIMCSTFLQVPLRYQLTHYGSRSYITDNISPLVPEREKDFPLFTKGKERIQFTYAVYLLNKNIAQLRWLFFMHTPELKATLPNLLQLLQGKEARDTIPWIASSLSGFNVNEACRDIDLSKTLQIGNEPKRYRMYKSNECGPGLSEILAIPEAFMNKQISSESFKNYAALKNSGGFPIVIKQGRSEESSQNCDSSETIEQGTDLLDPGLNLFELELEEEVAAPSSDSNGKCVVSNAPSDLVDRSREIGGASSPSGGSDRSSSAIGTPLMTRTDALLTTKSFNLVKPKSSL